MKTKIKGNVGQLKHMLKKTSCGRLFEPVAMKLYPDKNQIIVKKGYEGMTALTFLVFHNFEIDEDETVLVLDASGLSKQLKVIPNSHDFEAEITGGKIMIETPRDTIHYHLDDEWNDEKMYYGDMPIDAEDGRVYLIGKEKTPMTTKAKINSDELKSIEQRLNLSDASFVTFREENGKLKAEIGKLTSQKYHPRTFNLESEVTEGSGKGDSTSIAVGIKEIFPVIEGNVELHYLKGGPLALYDEDDSDEEGYESLYMIAPTGDVE